MPFPRTTSLPISLLKACPSLLPQWGDSSSSSEPSSPLFLSPLLPSPLTALGHSLCSWAALPSHQPQRRADPVCLPPSRVSYSECCQWPSYHRDSNTHCDIENTKDSIRKLLEPISQFSKVSGSEVNTQKSLAFLYITMKNLKEKLRNQSHSPL